MSERDLLFFQDLFAKMGINWGHAPIGFGVGLFLPPKGEIYGLEISFFAGERVRWIDSAGRGNLLIPRRRWNGECKKFGFCQLLRECNRFFF